MMASVSGDSIVVMNIFFISSFPCDNQNIFGFDSVRSSFDGIFFKSPFRLRSIFCILLWHIHFIVILFLGLIPYPLFSLLLFCHLSLYNTHFLLWFCLLIFDRHRMVLFIFYFTLSSFLSFHCHCLVVTDPRTQNRTDRWAIVAVFCVCVLTV